MVSIGLSAGSVARIRFAVSPLWEVVASLRVLRDPGDHAIHLPWVNRVRQALIAEGLIGTPSGGQTSGGPEPHGGLLWHLVPRRGYIPDFLTPAPSGLDGDLDAELAHLRDTPAEVVRADLDAYTQEPVGALREIYDEPMAGLAHLADEIAAYWRIALAADWPRIKVVLDGDVFHRARLLAEEGIGGLLNDLHQRVRWEDDTLTIASLTCTTADIADGGGLILVPSAFVWPSVFSIAASAPRQLAYPVRGIGTLWECRVTPEALASLIGRNRARLLVEMNVPTSTTELARRTGMSLGGVSQHLAVLRAAGLAAAHRQGKTVLNAQTSTAEALLAGSIR